MDRKTRELCTDIFLLLVAGIRVLGISMDRNNRDLVMEFRRLLLAGAAALEKYLGISPTSAELRKKGEEYIDMQTRGSLYSPD